MTKLNEVILRNTRANQPAAGVEGRLYYVIDESVLERDSGTAWEGIEADVDIAIDAADVTYTPAEATDWNDDTDPGNVDDALDQLAERATGTEGKKLQAIFTREGALTATAGTIRIANHTGRTLTISGVYLDANTAPTGAAIIVDIHKNGTTIFSNQAHRPQIAATEYSGNTTDIDVASWTNGQYLTCDVDQIGSTVAGSDLTITVVYS